MGLMDGKVAIVTGAGRGIGRAVAELMAVVSFNASVVPSGTVYSRNFAAGGSVGVCPGSRARHCSFSDTFLMPTIRLSGSNSVIRSTSRNGYRCGTSRITVNTTALALTGQVTGGTIDNTSAGDVTLQPNNRLKRTEEAIMPFELIMLMGFFGTALLALLPEGPARAADESFRGKHQKRSDKEQRRVVRAGRVMRRNEASRRRSAGRAAA